MVRYFYAWTPLAIVFGTVILLSIPYLALIALTIVSLAALTALAWAIVSAPRMLSRAISRSWHGRKGGIRQKAAALHVTGRPHAYAWRRIDYRTPQLVRSTESSSAGRLNGAPSQPAFRKGDVS